MKTKFFKIILFIIIGILLLYIIYRELTFFNAPKNIDTEEDLITTISSEWVDSNYQKMLEIESFLDENKLVNKNVLIEDVIKADNANVDIDIEDGFIGDIHTDNTLKTDFTFDNYIPKKITIKDNMGVEYEIDVFFGKTNSDNMSAYQKVSNNIINSLKHALVYANSNLYINEKIASIYIKCTINGKRAGPSNHPYGNAIDISRINGKRMLSTGVTRQIVLLQDGFNNYQYIRENFGPAYKHKYSIEKLLNIRWNRAYPVSGHRDHIHISVRK